MTRSSPRDLHWRWAIIVALTGVTWAAQRLDAAETFFSLDPASPSLPSRGSPAAVLKNAPATTLASASALGLAGGFPSGSFDNLNAISFGQDNLEGVIYFSVDRVAQGAPGSPVRQRVLAAQSAAPDLFAFDPVAADVRLHRPAAQLGLAGGFFGDDLDAANVFTQPNPYVYFALDRLSASSGGVRSRDILFSTLGGSFTTFAGGIAHIGLHADDEIDALLLLDRHEPGRLNPGVDVALFSLSPWSPSTFTYTGSEYGPDAAGRFSPADILWTDFTGNFGRWYSASDLGLLAHDNVNALAAVPEPGSALLLILGLLFGPLALGRRRRALYGCRSAAVDPAPHSGALLVT